MTTPTIESIKQRVEAIVNARMERISPGRRSEEVRAAIGAEVSSLLEQLQSAQQRAEAAEKTLAEREAVIAKLRNEAIDDKIGLESINRSLEHRIDELERAIIDDITAGRIETDKMMESEPEGYDSLRFSDVRHGWIFSTQNCRKAVPTAAHDAMERSDERTDLLWIARREINKLREQVTRLLEHCPDAECSDCATVICTHGDHMHFHHDGCPSCWTATRPAALAGEGGKDA